MPASRFRDLPGSDSTRAEAGARSHRRRAVGHRSDAAARTIGETVGAFVLIAAVATSRSRYVMATNSPVAEALTSGFQRVLLASSIFLVAAALIALRTGNTRGDCTARTK
ncbi:hypothetical protein [Rhodococcus opacus]|uniref:Hypothetical membrane protein n=1 Tax=Rhodococcus opacus (strain B4) TaxID=632772 RepID=C1ASW9_RHOOB|nr:hypothetical protein [Rhodococcus opacus]BAH48901.1 hypothetical membrane protein [Rhodococcus opacus B4]